MGDDSRDHTRPAVADGGSDAPTPTDTALDLETVFTILKHSRRRFVVSGIVDRTEWPLETVATELLASERDVSTAALSAADIDRARISLLHVHAPVLAAHDVARYDPDSELLRPDENASRLATILATIEAAVGGTS